MATGGLRGNVAVVRRSLTMHDPTAPDEHQPARLNQIMHLHSTALLAPSPLIEVETSTWWFAAVGPSFTLNRPYFRYSEHYCPEVGNPVGEKRTGRLVLLTTLQFWPHLKLCSEVLLAPPALEARRVSQRQRPSAAGIFQQRVDAAADGNGRRIGARFETDTDRCITFLAPVHAAAGVSVTPHACHAGVHVWHEMNSKRRVPHIICT